MKGTRPAPIMSLLGCEAGIVEPALVEEINGSVRTSGPRERGDRVNHKAILCSPSPRGDILYGCHRKIGCLRGVIGR